MNCTSTSALGNSLLKTWLYFLKVSLLTHNVMLNVNSTFFESYGRQKNVLCLQKPVNTRCYLDVNSTFFNIMDVRWTSKKRCVLTGLGLKVIMPNDIQEQFSCRMYLCF